ncbi:hypothetical protein AsAng_0021780 [Aureispira anguillae]|uniref:Uncharacterized protein n=1 Tax=Aureispira anguillae TaxID=2864201 RepID=A0A915YEA0_9BACT|nr:hypothetical protein AsAng_0021780 [Aureispira anguillae]
MIYKLKHTLCVIGGNWAKSLLFSLKIRRILLPNFLYPQI